MGCYDRVWFRDDSVRCSEGHSLKDEEFQTKDLGCTMGDVEIADGRYTFSPGGWDEPTKSERWWMCGDCQKCPAYVSASDGGYVQILWRFIKLVVHVKDGRVLRVEDVSTPLSEQFDDFTEEARAHWVGPMSPEEAKARYDEGIKQSQARHARKP